MPFLKALQRQSRELFQTILATGTQLQCTERDSRKGLGAPSPPQRHKPPQPLPRGVVCQQSGV